jgi:hypothetical protein
MHVYEIRPRKDKRGFDLISDVLPFGGLWYLEVSDAVEYAQFFSRSHDALIRVYDAAGNVIETHEHTGDFKERAIAQLDAREAWSYPHERRLYEAQVLRYPRFHPSL